MPATPRPLPTLPRPLRNLLAGRGLDRAARGGVGLQRDRRGGLVAAQLLAGARQPVLDVLEARVDDLADLRERLDDEVVGDPAAVDEVLDRLVALLEEPRVLGRAGAGARVVEVALGLQDLLARPLGDLLGDRVGRSRGEQAVAGLGRGAEAERCRAPPPRRVGPPAAGPPLPPPGPFAAARAVAARRGCCRLARPARCRRPRRPCRRPRSARPCRSSPGRSCRRRRSVISAPMITATSSRMPMYSPAVWPRSLRRKRDPHGTAGCQRAARFPRADGLNFASGPVLGPVARPGPVPL